MSNRSPAPLATIVGPTSGHRAPGQGLVEYALILLFVALVAIGALSLFGSAANGLYGAIVAAWPG